MKRSPLAHISAARAFVPFLVPALSLLTLGCYQADVGEFETPTVAEIERFADIDLPESTRDVDARLELGGDLDELLLRFTIDRQDQQRFVADSGFRKRFARGFHSVANLKAGWSTEQAKDVLGMEEPLAPGEPSRTVMIVLDDPAHPVVYLQAIRLPHGSGGVPE